MSLSVGQKAPDFKLPSSEQKIVSLSDFKGKNVILFFYPMAWTSTCTKEMCMLQEDYKQYEGLEQWIDNRFTKVCVQCNSEQELDDLYEQAKQANLICTMIIDEGLTEFNGVHTKTCIAIGPGPEDEINKITGHLSLM